MMRIGLSLVLLLAAGPLLAAPVPKELKVNASTAGTWRLGTPNPQAPGQLEPGNQYWIIDAECGVIFGPTPTPPAGAKPTEIFKFDPATRQVDHYTAGQAKLNYKGVYELNGDRLTICLDLRGGGTTRPKSVSDPGVTVWHLQRVEGTK